MRRRLPTWLLRRLRADSRGVAAIEFALVIPVVIVVYLVGFEVTEAATVYRKLTDTTVQLANVSAQYTTMTSTDATTVMTASSQIMAPYPTTNLTIVLTEVTNTAGGVGQVTWSQAYGGGTALTTGTTIATPTGFQTAGASYMLVQTTYAYQPSIGAAFIGTIPMKNQIFMLPRSSSSIPCTVTGTTNTVC
jgi:Flp pilus assembly protein TadG